MEFIKNIVIQVNKQFYNLVNVIIFKSKRVISGKNLHTRGCIYIKTGNKIPFIGKRSIYLGNNICINSSFVSNPIGSKRNTVFYTRQEGKIIIKDGVGMSNCTIVSQKLVEIGKYSNIGCDVAIYDTDFHSLMPEIRLHGDTDVNVAPVIIGDMVFIGAKSIILKGVTIGDRSIVGAGSVVAKSIPENEIWAGNPAKFIRKVDKYEVD